LSDFVDYLEGLIINRDVESALEIECLGSGEIFGVFEFVGSSEKLGIVVGVDVVQIVDDSFLRLFWIFGVWGFDGDGSDGDVAFCGAKLFEGSTWELTAFRFGDDFDSDVSLRFSLHFGEIPF